MLILNTKKTCLSFDTNVFHNTLLFLTFHQIHLNCFVYHSEKIYKQFLLPVTEHFLILNNQSVNCLYRMSCVWHKIVLQIPEQKPIVIKYVQVDFYMLLLAEFQNKFLYLSKKNIKKSIYKFFNCEIILMKLKKIVQVLSEYIIKVYI